MSRNLGALTLLDPSGPAWPVMGVLYLFIIYSKVKYTVERATKAQMGSRGIAVLFL
jgi:hypothetical protein